MSVPRLTPGGEITRAESLAPEISAALQPALVSELSGTSLSDYWRLILKRKWLILAVIVLCVGVTVFVTMRTVPIYVASARISINRPNDFLNLKDVNGGATASDDDYTVSIETQVNVLQSDSIALAVINKLNLANNPAFGGSPQAAKTGGVIQALDTRREAGLISAVEGSLRVTPIPNTRVLNISFSSPDPKLAADICNAVVATYIEQNIKRRFDSTMQAADWLSKQLADLQIKVEQSEQKLVQYRREHEILGGDEKSNIITSKLEDLNKELGQAEADRIQKQSLYTYAVSHGEAGLAETETLRTLHAQEATLTQQYAQMSVNYGPSFPKLVELKAQLEQVRQNIQTERQKTVAQLQSQYMAAVQREKMLQQAFNQQKSEANQLNQSAIEYGLLSREAESNRQLYDGLLQKLKEAGLTAGLNSSNVTVVDAARIPLAPSYPNKLRNMELGVLIGISLGVALAFLVEAVDTAISTPEQVEALGMTSLALIPLADTVASVNSRNRKLLHQKGDPALAASSKQVSVDIVTQHRPKSEVSEAYRALRTSILLSSVDKPPKVLLITSALPQEGKTTTALNTAIVLSQQERRVLLVDADLRRPRIHRAFGLRPRGGLSEVLTGAMKWDEVVMSAPGTPYLSILGSGATPPHPAELLGSPRMRNLLSEWREKFDHVVIDTPPALTVTDAVLLSVEADRVVLVIRSGHTSNTALRRTRALLSRVNARTLGVVINAVDLRSPDHYYYYYSGSKYYGGYYGDQAEHD